MNGNFQFKFVEISDREFESVTMLRISYGESQKTGTGKINKLKTIFLTINK